MRRATAGSTARGWPLPASGPVEVVLGSPAGRGVRDASTGLSDGGAEARGPGVPPARETVICGGSKPGTCARRAGLVRLTSYRTGQVRVRGARRGGGGRRRGRGDGMSDQVATVIEPVGRAALAQRAEVALAWADCRRGAGGGGAVPRILRRADRQPADAGGVRAGGGAVSWPGARRAAWRSRRSRRCTWRPTSGRTPGRRRP